eukprot:562063-Prorocentrum_lima.AAC.1
MCIRDSRSVEAHWLGRRRMSTDETLTGIDETLTRIDETLTDIDETLMHTQAITHAHTVTPNLRVAV